MEVVELPEFRTTLLPRAQAAVTFQPERSTTPRVKENAAGSGKVALWDDGNDFPQKVVEEVRKDPETPTLLNKKAALLYSGGLVWGKVRVVDGGREIMEPLEPKKHNQIRDWMRRSAIKRYLIEASTDFYWFANFFPEFVTTRDRSQIANLCVQAAEHCRWGLMDKSGVVKHCYVNANWPDAKPEDPETKTLAVVDPYYNAAENFRAMTKVTNAIYPVSYPSPGSNYYQLADWNSIRQGGWLEVSQLIPKFKKAMLEKQATVKYHIEISDLYWATRWPNFSTLDEKKKLKLRDQVLKEVNDVITGAENAGASVVSAFKTDLASGKELSFIKIKPIDDLLKDGKYLEDGKDASLYKSMAIGLHPALVGNVPNSGLGGAGSNIREAYNLHMLMIKAHQDLILEPLEVIRDYNGWDPDVEFRFRNSFMNTLDKGEETSETAA